MTILRLTRKLRTWLDRTFPADITSGLTIQAVNGNTITLNTSIGAANVWQGGLLRIMSGGLEKETVAISANTGQVVYISTPFPRDDYDALVGATVNVVAGPLGAASVFHIQPKSIKDLVDGGVNDFVFINPISHEVMYRGLGRDTPSLAARNQDRSYTLQVMCQVPFASGATTAADAYTKQTRIYDFSEQVISRLHSFKAQVTMPLYDDSPMQINYGILEREGAGPAEVAIIEIDFSLAL